MEIEMKYVGFIVLVCLLWQAELHAESVNFSDLKERVDKIEVAAKQQKNDYENLKKQVTVDVGLHKKEIEIELKGFKQEYGVLKKVTVIFGVSSILGLLLLWFGMWRFIDKSRKEMIEKKLQDKQELLLNVIEVRDSDSRLRKKKRIVVVSSGEKNQNLLRDLLVTSGFEKVEYVEIGELKTDVKADLTIVNDDGNGFGDDEQTVRDVIESMPTKMVFYFGPKRIKFEEINEKKMASASFPSQVYGNLMSAMHYQDALIKS